MQTTEKRGSCGNPGQVPDIMGEILATQVETAKAPAPRVAGKALNRMAGIGAQARASGNPAPCQIIGISGT